MDIVDRLPETRATGPGNVVPGGLVRHGLVALYSATLLLAACLLFSVQPMFTKRVLPLLGGTPAVWSVAMVVFQALLLAGYAYAHASIRWLPQRVGVAVHLVLLGAGFSALPIAVAAGFDQPPEQAEAVWLGALFLASIGLPFFALSASAPLLQAWFVRSGDRHGQDPYFLYGASNAGSFLALLAYPFLIEPIIGLDRQAGLWTFGYAMLACAILACGLTARGSARSATEATTPAPSARRRLAWIALSAVPSGLLVAATAHISTDVAAIPLLWVLPLALYLLSFILAFRSVASWPGRVLGGVQVGLTAFELATITFKLNVSLGQLAITLGLLFLNALIAHRSVYALRPPAARLTEFYLCTSLGGVIGGVFAALLAPWLFSGIYEYPILLVAALACRPGFSMPDGAFRKEGRYFAIVLVSAVTLAWAVGATFGIQIASAIFFACLLFAFASNWRDPARALAYGIVIGVAGIVFPLFNQNSERYRSFFGLHRIETIADGRFRVLWHGTTLHGAIRLRNDDGTFATGRPEPLSYYTEQGPVAEVLTVARSAFGDLSSVSVVGLGAGSLACHSRPGETWRFFEIDPVVIRLATDPHQFRYLSECAPAAAIIPGDARLTLARRKGEARVLILDAFSSDSIPVHLLTREAVDIALGHLERDGVLAFHISNRHFLLTHVLARIAAERGLRLLVRLDTSGEPFEQRMRAASRAVMMTAEPAVQAEAKARGWSVVEPDTTRRPWTDDYANPFEAMLDQIRN